MHRRSAPDGARILYDFAEHYDLDELSDLVVVTSGQRAFTEVVRNYLTRITYSERDQLATRIILPVTTSRSWGSTPNAALASLAGQKSQHGPAGRPSLGQTDGCAAADVPPEGELTQAEGFFGEVSIVGVVVRRRGEGRQAAGYPKQGETNEEDRGERVRVAGRRHGRSGWCRGLRAWRLDDALLER